MRYRTYIIADTHEQFRTFVRNYEPMFYDPPPPVRMLPTKKVNLTLLLCD